MQFWHLLREVEGALKTSWTPMTLNLDERSSLPRQTSCRNCVLISILIRPVSPKVYSHPLATRCPRRCKSSGGTASSPLAPYEILPPACHSLLWCYGDCTRIPEALYLNTTRTSRSFLRQPRENASGCRLRAAKRAVCKGEWCRKTSAMFAYEKIKRLSAWGGGTVIS